MIFGSIPENQGRLQVGTIADPGAGNTVQVFTQAGSRWLVHAIACDLTTDITVATRQVYWEYWDGVTAGAMVMTSVAQPASLTRTYNFLSGWTAASQALIIDHFMPLSPRMLVSSTFGLRISAVNFQAGDAFSNIIYVGERWIED